MTLDPDAPPFLKLPMPAAPPPPPTHTAAFEPGEIGKFNTQSD